MLTKSAPAGMLVRGIFRGGIDEMGDDMRSRTIRRGRLWATLGTAGVLTAGLGFAPIAGAAPAATSALANSRPAFASQARIWVLCAAPTGGLRGVVESARPVLGRGGGPGTLQPGQPFVS